MAINIVADNLIPKGGAIEESRGREKSLNTLGCNVHAREVNDVAPGKLVIYVSFQVSEKLDPFNAGWLCRYGILMHWQACTGICT